MRALLALSTILLLAAPAHAGAPTEAQKAEFKSVCLSVSGGNTALCSCKADAAMTLIDERFMAVVIASMKGGAPSAGDYDAYNTYVAKSNRVCKPDY